MLVKPIKNLQSVGVTEVLMRGSVWMLPVVFPFCSYPGLPTCPDPLSRDLIGVSECETASCETVSVCSHLSAAALHCWLTHAHSNSFINPVMSSNMVHLSYCSVFPIFTGHGFIEDGCPLVQRHVFRLL